MRPETLERVTESIFCKNSCGVGWRLDGLVVLDADSKESVEWMEGAIASGALPETVSVDTHRGRHYFYRRTEQIKKKAKIGLPGNIRIDVLTGQKCYVVAVGSEAEGYTRDWTPNRSPDDIDVAWLDDQEIEVIQNWLSETEQIKPQRRTNQTFGEHASETVAAPATSQKRPDSSLEFDYEKGVEEGRLDATCFALVLFYWRRGRSRQEIKDTLLGWNLRNVPPWSKSGDGSSPEDWIWDKIDRICHFRPVMSKPWPKTKRARCEKNVMMWAAESLEIDPDIWVLLPDAIDDFIAWCSRAGMVVWSRKMAGMAIRAVLPVSITEYSYPRKGVKHQYRLHGIRLRKANNPSYGPITRDR